MTNSTTPTPAAQWNPTTEELVWMQGQLAEEYPQLSVTVTMQAGALHVEALPRS